MEPAIDVLARPVVVGVGEGPCSNHAVQTALELAREFQTPVEFVHGVTEGGGAVSETPLASRGAANARRLTTACECVGKALDDLGLCHDMLPPSRSLRVLPGKAARVIIERAKEVDAGMILLGAHRRRGFFDFGSTTRAVLTHAPCAVWSQTEPPRPIRRILVPVDLSEDSRGALEFACDLSRRMGGCVKALHCFVNADSVVDDQRHRRAECEAFLAEHGAPDTELDTAFFDGDPASVVLAMQDSVDLIVMATHGRGRLSAAVLGSVTNTVLRQAHVPVIAVRHASRLLDLPT
jgi:nucleotide-binding universal stress UspA family protein